jgi:hypothetical protein
VGGRRDRKRREGEKGRREGDRETLSLAGGARHGL